MLKTVAGSFQFFVSGSILHGPSGHRRDIVLGTAHFVPVSLLDCLQGKTLYSPVVSKEHTGGGEIAVHCLFVSETAPFRTRIATRAVSVAAHNRRVSSRSFKLELPPGVASFDQDPVQDVAARFSFPIFTTLRLSRTRASPVARKRSTKC